VHFLRFELEGTMIQALKKGARLALGIDHPQYRVTLDEVPAAVAASLAGDLKG
jgi:hypothetical protein